MIRISIFACEHVGFVSLVCLIDCDHGLIFVEVERAYVANLRLLTYRISMQRKSPRPAP